MSRRRGCSSVEPTPNAVDVPSAVFIQVAFTEPIDPSTVHATSVRVSSGGVSAAGTLTLFNGNPWFGSLRRSRCRLER